LEANQKNCLQRFGDKIKQEITKLSKKLAPIVVGSIAGTTTVILIGDALTAVTLPLGLAVPFAIPIATGLAGTLTGAIAKDSTNKVIDMIDGDEKDEKK
jgi:hypothetical protein